MNRFEALATRNLPDALKLAYAFRASRDWSCLCAALTFDYLLTGKELFGYLHGSYFADRNEQDGTFITDDWEALRDEACSFTDAHEQAQTAAAE